MDQIVITIIACGLATGSIIFGYLQRRKAAEACSQNKGLQAQLKELGKQQKQKASSQKAHQNQIQDKNKIIAKLEKELEQKYSGLQAKISGLQQSIVEQDKQKLKLESKIEHYKTESAALLVQLKEIDQEKKEYRLKVTELEKGLTVQIEHETASLKEQVKEAKGKVKSLENKIKIKENKLKKVQEDLKKIDPHALKKAKSKINQYHHLYNIIKGQKDLLEGRNRNWELALRMLATWVCKEKGQAQIPENLGALVANALELSKSGPLIDAKDDVSVEYKEELKEIEREDKMKSRAAKKTEDSVAILAAAAAKEGKTIVTEVSR